MKGKIVYFLTIVICFLLQCTVMDLISIGSVTPNLMLVFCVSMGLMRGRKSGLWAGFFSGLFVDLFFGSVFGFYALIYMYIGYLSGYAHRIYYDDDVKVPMFLTAIADLLYNLSVYGLQFLLRGRLGLGTYLYRIIIPEMFYTVFITLIVYRIFRYINYHYMNITRKESESNLGTKIKRIFKKISLKRTTVLILVFVIMSVVLVRRLFDLQIIQGEDYISKFQARTTKERVLKSTRGNILDRNGDILASNVLSYSLTLEDNGTYTSTREKNLTLNGVAYQVLQILHSNGDDITHSFHIVVDKNGEYAFDVAEGFTLNRFRADIYGQALIDDLKDEQKTATADQMMEFLTGSEKFSIVLSGDRAYTEDELTPMVCLLL